MPPPSYFTVNNFTIQSVKYFGNDSVHFSNDFRFEMDSQVFAISKETMEGSGEGLMDHIAECLATFAKGRKISKKQFFFLRFF